MDPYETPALRPRKRSLFQRLLKCFGRKIAAPNSECAVIRANLQTFSRSDYRKSCVPSAFFINPWTSEPPFYMIFPTSVSEEERLRLFEEVEKQRFDLKDEVK